MSHPTERPLDWHAIPDDAPAWVMEDVAAFFDPATPPTSEARAIQLPWILARVERLVRAGRFTWETPGVQALYRLRATPPPEAHLRERPHGEWHTIPCPGLPDGGDDLVLSSYGPHVMPERGAIAVTQYRELAELLLLDVPDLPADVLESIVAQPALTRICTAVITKGMRRPDVTRGALDALGALMLEDRAGAVHTRTVIQTAAGMPTALARSPLLRAITTGWVVDAIARQRREWLPFAEAAETAIAGESAPAMWAALLEYGPAIPPWLARQSLDLIAAKCAGRLPRHAVLPLTQHPSDDIREQVMALLARGVFAGRDPVSRRGSLA